MYNKRQISCQNFIKVLEGKEGKKLPHLGFQCLDHPLYSPDLAPSDYYLIPGLKTQLKVYHFSSDEELIATAESWFDGQRSEFSF